MSLCFTVHCVSFFNDTATTAIYTYLHTLSLHDALPIFARGHILRARHLRAAILGRASLQVTARRYGPGVARSEEHTSELQSLMRISYAVFCLKKKKQHRN